MLAARESLSYCTGRVSGFVAEILIADEPPKRKPEQREAREA
jgi:hypothetical protein